MENNLNERESSMNSFLDEVNKTIESENATQRFENSPKAKLRLLNQVKDDARGECYNRICSKIYMNALPLSDDYKASHIHELDSEFRDYVSNVAPKGLEYYIQESIKRGNKAAKLMNEGVDKLVKDTFVQTGLNLPNVDTEDIAFNPDDEDTAKRIDEISSNMQSDEISEIIKDNVRNAALADIKKTKDRDAEVENIVNDLKNDPTVTTEAAAERRLRLAGVLNPKRYEPSLFEGIMINKRTLVQESCDDIDNEHINKKAFTESVKEMTKINTLSTLGIINMDMAEGKKLGSKYSKMEIPYSRI